MLTEIKNIKVDIRLPSIFIGDRLVCVRLRILEVLQTSRDLAKAILNRFKRVGMDDMGKLPMKHHLLPLMLY